MPHPQGMISVDYTRQGDRLTATITLPEGVTGTFHWRGETRPLRGGENRLRL